MDLAIDSKRRQKQRQRVCWLEHIFIKDKQRATVSSDCAHRNSPQHITHNTTPSKASQRIARVSNTQKAKQDLRAPLRDYVFSKPNAAKMRSTANDNAMIARSVAG